jgi:predicted molibdopterin-dependent oxidoreductase YjgC
VGGIGSTHTTNEEAYLFQKLLRTGIGTNNVDHWHGSFPDQRDGDLPWVWTGSIAGLDRASHIVLLGADPYERQPIIDLRIRKAIRAGAQLIVVTSEPLRLDRLATSVIRYQPGQTGTVARALRALIASEPHPLPPLLRGEGGPEAFSALPPDAGGPEGDAAALAGQAGVELEALRALVRTLVGARAATLLYDERATREPSGANLAADALAVALLTGNFGQPGAGAGPLLGAVNSLGARDMGLLPDLLPGYVGVGDEAGRGRLAREWGGAEPPAMPGLGYAAMLAGGVKALYVMGADPAHHVDPAALEHFDFLVVQDLFLTETAQRADVVLPAVAYAEKDGSFTNTERCVQAVRRAMIPLPGARADWEILGGVARALGLRWSYRGPSDVLAEIGRVVPIYAGLTRRALGARGLRWPIMLAQD